MQRKRCSPHARGVVAAFRGRGGGSDHIIENVVAYGKSTAFIANIAEAKADCETFLGVQDTGQRGSVEANADEADILHQALAIKKSLKRIVLNIFEDDPGKLANWRSACHVKRAPKKKKDDAPPPPTP